METVGKRRTGNIFVRLRNVNGMIFAVNGKHNFSPFFILICE